MPIYVNSQRKSFIPDAYKRISGFQKFRTTPYYERRKSSPYIQDKEIYENHLEFASDSTAQNHKDRDSLSKMKRVKCFIKRNTKSLRLSKSKINNPLEKLKEPPDRISYVNRLWNKEKPKNNQENVLRRQSERKHDNNSPKTKPTRYTISYRYPSYRKESSLKNNVPEDNLALICQLLLIRSISPKGHRNSDLTDQFDIKMDENFFQFYPFVFKYLYQKEQEIKFNKDYLLSNGFTEQFRSTLIDWLIKVQLYSKLSTETLQVAVVLIDMFTSICLVRKSYYQLVGISALLIACKVVQRFHPRIKEFCYLTEDSYKPSHVVQMEWIMLDKLNFFVNIPIPNHFCHRGLLACVEIMDTNLIELFCTFMFDLIMLHPASPGIRSSCKSAAAIFMARFILYPEYPPWTKVLQHYTLYRDDQLKDCVLLYMEMMVNIYQQSKYHFKAVLEKYSVSVKKSIANNKILVEFITNSNSKQNIINYFERLQ